MNDLVEDTLVTRMIRNTRRSLADAALARASGRWGANNVCIPADAQAWKSSLERPFNGSGRWAAYQKYKCGPNECSVSEERNRNRAPIADGVNPNASNPSGLGCLILEAKSSYATQDKDSLYGMRAEEDRGLFDSFRRRVKKIRKFGRVIDFETWQDLFLVSPLLGAGEGSGRDLGTEPGELEDVEGDAWDDRDDNQSPWTIVRQRQIAALILYEVACSLPEVPFTKYVMILERPFMQNYFESIITPNGHLVVSPFDNNQTWRP
jgi:hypothetical protein